MDGLPFRRIYTGDEELRLRVNDPHTSLDPLYGGRPEAGAPGIAFIDLDADIFDILEARLRLELWGGHPGTAAKRVTVNGRGNYYLPETGTALGHCTYSDISIPLSPGDLIRGRNGFQFSCDRGSSFWGHYIIDNLALELGYKNPPPWILSRIPFFASPPPVELDLSERERGVHFRLTSRGMAGLERGELLRADIFASYPGPRLPLDGEGGDRKFRGYMRGRRWCGNIGSLNASIRELFFDPGLLPLGTKEVTFSVELSLPGGLFALLELGKNAFSPGAGGRMLPFFPVEQPRPFWSRAGKRAEARFVLDQVDRRDWKLQVRFWNGGAGTVTEPVRLNGHPLQLLSSGAPHDLEGYEIDLEPSLLREGENRFTLLSDTEHHGIELLYPGPVILGYERDGQ